MGYNKHLLFHNTELWESRLSHLTIKLGAQLPCLRKCTILLLLIDLLYNKLLIFVSIEMDASTIGKPNDCWDLYHLFIISKFLGNGGKHLSSPSYQYVATAKAGC